MKRTDAKKFDDEIEELSWKIERQTLVDLGETELLNELERKHGTRYLCFRKKRRGM